MRTFLTSLKLLVTLGLTTVFQATGQESLLDIKVTSVTDTLLGRVGELERDRLGNIYMADFTDKVWKVNANGDVSVFSNNMYGASGNALDRRGNLYQAQYYGQTIVRINRYTEQVTEVATEGLFGPVGLTFKGDDLFVCNCDNNTISKLGEDQKAVEYSKSPLFNCPNGITVGPDGNLYVVNYSNPNVVRIDENGAATLFAQLPAISGGHIIAHKGNFYVTSFFSHKIFKISATGEITHFAGSGEQGEEDGIFNQAQFSNPNGIVATAGTLYVNDRIFYADGKTEGGVLRKITFPELNNLLTQAMTKGGLEEATKIYKQYKAHATFRHDNTEQEVNAFAYTLLNRKDLDSALAIFRLNTEAYPKSFNAWDSLAEAYLAKGDKSNAKKYYEKSLEINPKNSNAIEKLKGL